LQRGGSGNCEIRISSVRLPFLAALRQQRSFETERTLGLKRKKRGIEIFGDRLRALVTLRLPQNRGA